jgi:hypothetical protein
VGDRPKVRIDSSIFSGTEMIDLLEQPTERTNPFCTPSTLNAPLSLDLCQHIHYTALCQVARNGHEVPPPVNLYLPELKERARWQGRSVYLLHPDDIERIFRGVTLSVYQRIEQLYCSRLELSISMVNRILMGMAAHAKANAIDLEAVWAICRFMDERREKATAVTIERTNAIWWLGRLPIITELRDPRSSAYCPVIRVIADSNETRIHAFQATHDEHDSGTISLALYNALTAQRMPAPFPQGTAGLCWKLPTRLVTDVDLPSDCLRACNTLGLQVERSDQPPAFLLPLIDNWTKDFASRSFTTPRFLQVFDTYIHRTLGSSPMRHREEQQRVYAHLVGYNRDPAWQLPALRLLLPSKEGVISSEGTIAYNGRTYGNELLRFWPGLIVTVRQSAANEADAWVYQEGELLCVAKAQELRRSDGTYRS